MEVRARVSVGRGSGLESKWVLESRLVRLRLRLRLRVRARVPTCEWKSLWTMG